MQTLDIQREETEMRCMGPKLAAGLQPRPKHIHMQNNYITQNHILPALKQDLIADNQMPQAETITHPVTN